MKILILGAAGCYHIDKWVIGLAQKGIEVKVASLVEDLGFYNGYPKISVESLGLKDEFIAKRSQVDKLRYFKFIFRIKRIIKEFKPDIVHSHYATSYGILGALCGFSPYIVSVWGSDVYDFPKKSILHRALIKFVLNKAILVLSTSNCMAKVTEQYTRKPIVITPFGIDINKFKPLDEVSLDKDEITIGTVKALTPKYGIDILIKAFARLSAELDFKLRLKIVGKGKSDEEYKVLAKELGLSKTVDFLGYVDNSKIPEVLNDFDIYAALSTLDSESFGVAVVEAMACELPVVVTAVDGFKEVVPDSAGLIIAKENVDEAYKALKKLVLDKVLREKMGKAGRQHVIENYIFENNLADLIQEYKKIIN